MFHGHEGDHEGKGTVLVWVLEAAFGPASSIEAQGGAMAGLVALLSFDTSLFSLAPLNVYTLFYVDIRPYSRCPLCGVRIGCDTLRTTTVLQIQQRQVSCDFFVPRSPVTVYWPNFCSPWLD